MPAFWWAWSWLKHPILLAFKGLITAAMLVAQNLLYSKLSKKMTDPEQINEQLNLLTGSFKTLYDMTTSDKFKLYTEQPLLFEQYFKSCVRYFLSVVLMLTEGFLLAYFERFVRLICYPSAFQAHHSFMLSFMFGNVTLGYFNNTDRQKYEPVVFICMLFVNLALVPAFARLLLADTSTI